MTLTDQQPLGTPFSATTTAEDVMADCDLSGMTAVVTGGYSGLGLETARALTAAGARVIVPARRPQVARSALREVKGCEVVPMDLADLASVRSAARHIGDRLDRLDLLMAVAGVMAIPERRVGPGWEGQLAANHLGHFTLACELYPLLAAADGARVVVNSSAGHTLTGIRWHDPHFRTGYDKWLAYGQAKTANALAAAPRRPGHHHLAGVRLRTAASLLRAHRQRPGRTRRVHPCVARLPRRRRHLPDHPAPRHRRPRMKTTADLVSDYLRVVEREASALPADRRQELLADLAEHIEVTLAERPDASLGEVLAELGDPRTIAATALAEAGIGAAGAPARSGGGGPARRGKVHPLVPLLMLTLSLPFVMVFPDHLGPLIGVLFRVTGAVLLCTSVHWTAVQKTTGALLTAVLPTAVIAAWNQSTSSPAGDIPALAANLVTLALLAGTVTWLWRTRRA